MDRPGPALQVETGLPAAAVGLAAAGAGFVLVALLALDLAPPVRLALLAAFGLAAVAAARVLRAQCARVALEWREDGSWLERNTGNPLRLDAATRVHAHCVVLVLRGAGGRRRWWLCRSGREADGFRRLKARLRLAAAAIGPEPAC